MDIVILLMVIDLLQKLLCKRLQQNWFKGIDESNEVRNLELFKIRFGEDEVSKCSVMFKDFSDSRRINEYFNEKKSAESLETDAPVFIISHHFWPEIKEVEIDLPNQIQKSFDEFKEGFEKQKVTRSLRLLKGVGSVDLDLEFDDEVRSFKVNPVLASIILKFEEQGIWTLDKLSVAVKIPPTLLLKKLGFWMQQGVLKPVKGKENTFKVVDQIGPVEEESVLLDAEEQETEDECDEEKQEEILATIWNYIKGMLNNLGSLPSDRIFSMLAMFSSSESQIDIKQLRDILNKKVQQGHLSCEQGKYSLISE